MIRTPFNLTTHTGSVARFLESQCTITAVLAGNGDDFNSFGITKSSHKGAFQYLSLGRLLEEIRTAAFNKMP